MSTQSTFQEELYEPTKEGIVLAIFGQNNKMTEHELHVNVLCPILAELGQTPLRVLVPSDGTMPIYVHDWAEANRMYVQTFHADWRRHGRIAQILRDDHMQNTCTHAIVFLSARSNRLEKFAERLARKKKRVFTVSAPTSTGPYIVQELCVEEPTPCLVSTLARKSNKGTMHSWLQYQTKEAAKTG